jgi:peptide/histidine transporter 3/4
MEVSTSLLITSSTRKTKLQLLKRRLKQYFFKGQWSSLLVIFWIGIVSFFAFPVFLVTDLQGQNEARIRGVFLIIKGLVYLLFPFFGLIADACIKRYIVIGVSLYTILISMLAGVAVSCVGSLIDLDQLNEVAEIAVGISAGFFVATSLLGVGLFMANAIQFGTSQMLDATSGQLSGFIHWYCWANRLGCLIMFYTTMAIKYTTITSTPIINDKKHLIQDILYYLIYLTIAQIVLVIIAIVIYHASKHHLNIEPANKNPIKTIVEVLKYSLRHKYPEKRSAFTYWEQDTPSRIDIGKDKYGGPFTTEQVEDTKTFLRMSLVLLSLFGSGIIKNNTHYIASYIIENITNSSSIDISGDPRYIIIGINPDHITLLTVLLVIPITQVIIKPVLHNYNPNMLKKFWFGLIICFLSSASVLIIKYLILYVNGRFHLYLALLSIPQILNGLAYILISITGLEFILAQAPHTMQGLLIGLWYMSDIVGIILEGIELALHNQIIYIVRFILTIISLIGYSVVYYFYKYRDRDNIVNTYHLVADKIERNIANAHYSSSNTSCSTELIVTSANTSINES